MEDKVNRSYLLSWPDLFCQCFFQWCWYERRANLY